MAQVGESASLASAKTWVQSPVSTLRISSQNYVALVTPVTYNILKLG
jgi:hypothetical protein